MEEKILKALQEKGAMKLAKEGKIYSPKRCFYDIRK